MSDSTPSYLIPKMGEFAVSNTATYQRLFINDLNQGRRKRDELDQMIDPFAKLDIEEMEDRPAMGVLLSYEQGWFQEGLALGNLLHSVCLAPGEVTKIAIVDWRRQQTNTDQSAIRAESSQKQQARQNSHSHEVQNLTKESVASGSEIAIGSSTQSQVAGNAGSIFGGVSGSKARNSSFGLSATMAVGSEDVAADSTRDVSQLTQQAAQATRAQRSTRVVEASASESESISTRVVANYNHMHAMTVQYYETLQVFTLKTRVAKAQRCLFIPFRVREFDLDYVLDHRELLTEISASLGDTSLAVALESFNKTADEIEANLKTLQDLVDNANQRIADLTKDMDENATRAVAEDAHFRIALSEFRIAVERGIVQGKISEEEIQRRLERLRLYEQRKEAEDARDMHNAVLTTQRQLAFTTNQKIFDIINKDQLFFNQQMWLRLSAYQIHRIVYPYRFEGEPLSGLIDPKPVGTFGHYMAFVWNFDSDKSDERDAFKARYEQRDNEEITTQIVLPTEGVFAEAVLGQSNSAEEIDLTRFWNWSESPIPILPPEIAPIERKNDGSTGAQPGSAQFATPLPFMQVPAMPQGPSLDLAAALQALQSSTPSGGGRGGAAASIAATTSNNATAGAAKATDAATEAQKTYTKFVVDMANSDLVKSIATTALPAGKGASLIGGLMNAAKKSVPSKKGGSA